MSKSINLAVIAGDGIGPEVVAEGLKVLDVVVTETGCLNLSEHIPHHPDEIEAWMASLR